MELTLNSKRVLIGAPLAAGLFWAASNSISVFPGLPSLSEFSTAGAPLMKLMAAAAVGFMITGAQRLGSREKLLSRPMDQAQILLCVGAAMIVTLIGDSLARAVGVLGGAAIVRFRTPVEDPKEATVLFTLLGMGMACGLAYYTFAGVAAVFLSIVLVSFHDVKEQKLRCLSLQVVSSGSEPPVQLIESALTRFAASFEPREISKGERMVVRYSVSVAAEAELSKFSQQLLAEPESGIHSISWDTPKKERYL
jgi:uncharacterized membrane protein YhiD involved in acid resistance